MKTTMLTKAMMAVLFAMTSVLTLNAAKPVKITNEEVENGRVSAKVVYEQEGTFLTPEYRFEFRYNDKGQIIEKKSMKWNGTDWINYYCMEDLPELESQAGGVSGYFYRDGREMAVLPG